MQMNPIEVHTSLKKVHQMQKGGDILSDEILTVVEIYFFPPYLLAHLFFQIFQQTKIHRACKSTCGLHFDT